jgi:hypothetical protein
MAGPWSGGAMGWLTRSMAALLRRLAGLVAADRREWAEAVCAEAAEIPAGRPRLAWLAGGLWLVATDARVVRGIGYSLAFGVAAAGTAYASWGGAAANPATLINRVDVVTIMLLLAGLPWVVGPANSGRITRVIRAAGYAAILALVLVKAAVERFAYASAAGAAPLLWTGEIIFLVVVAAYVAGILAVTARRTSAAPATLVIGTAAGVAFGVLIFALGPLGSPLTIGGWPAWLYDAAMVLGLSLALAAPVATGVLAARRTARRAGCRDSHLTPAADPARQAAIAGLCGGVAAALVASVLSTGTIALLPHEATLLQWAMAHSRLFVGPAGHGTPHEYAVTSSAAAAGYVALLIFAPLLGCGLSAWGGLAAVGRPDRPGGRPGGGGPSAPEPAPPPPGGGRRPGRERNLAEPRGGQLVKLATARQGFASSSRPAAPRERRVRLAGPAELLQRPAPAGWVERAGHRREDLGSPAVGHPDPAGDRA